MGFSDLLAFIDRSLLRSGIGDVATYAPGVGDPVAVPGFFDAVYTTVDLGQAGVSQQGPAIFFRLSDLPSDPAADALARITVAGVTYRVAEAMPDGMGGILLKLKLHEV